MNAERLLALYDRISEAPDAVARLRCFILDLAVRGKLVEQDPTDEPASELLNRIAGEKVCLIKAGEIGKEKPLPPLSVMDETFPLPDGWTWVRLGNLSELVTSGSRDWAKYYSNEGAIFVRMGNLSKDHYRLRLDQIQRVKPPTDGEGTRTRLEAGDILISITGDVGMLGLIPEGFGEAYINQHTAMVRPMPEMKGRYLAELFRSPFAQIQFNEPQRGIKNSFRLTDVTQFVVPLPPLAEQHRIVAKVDELMALCDRLEKERTRREALRDRVTTASLARLTAPEADGEAFTSHARFTLDNLSALTARPDQIKALRQTILNLAVRGKLVEQNPADEPASELLKRIRAEKAGLDKGKKRKRKTEIEPVQAGELPFSMPAGWHSARIQDLLIGIQTGPFGSSLHQSDYQVGGTPVINPASIQNGRIVSIEKMAVGPKTLDRLATFKLRTGDIVMARRGEMGRCAIVTPVEDGWLYGTGSLTLRPSKLIFARFLVLLIGSPFGRTYLGGTAVGSTMQNLNQSILLNLPFGLPPFAEQCRIVAKVDDLMALCSSLEASLTTAATTRDRLLDALLHEALAPAAGTQEAAE